MNNEIKEKLIELVRQNECIYKTIHKDYKNASYKTLLWENIGAALGIEGTKAKETWRVLRDGYIRHLKSIKGQTGASASKKYSKFTWSSQMSFLDGTLQLRATSSNIAPLQLPSFNLSPVPRQSQPSSLEQPPVPRQSQPSPLEQSGPSWLHSEVDDSLPPPLRTSDPPPTPQLPPPTNTQPMPSPASRKRNDTTKKNDSRSPVDNTERVLDYLKNKKKKEWDSIDLLFMSYAHSFKKFSVQNQSKIKVKLAKLFADTELEEFQNRQNESSPVMYLSPAYSIMSDDSPVLIAEEQIQDSPVLITEEKIQEPIQPSILVVESPSHAPTQEVMLAIDLTNYNSNESQN